MGIGIEAVIADHNLSFIRDVRGCSDFGVHIESRMMPMKNLLDKVQKTVGKTGDREREPAHLEASFASF